MVHQSGTATLQGYNSGEGFFTISDVDVEFPDDRHILMRWPEKVMALTSNTMQAGFGAGWCSADTKSYCDHFPDGWGYYYTSFDSGDFFTLSW